MNRYILWLLCTGWATGSWCCVLSGMFWGNGENRNPPVHTHTYTHTKTSNINRLYTSLSHSLFLSLSSLSLKQIHIRSFIIICINNLHMCAWASGEPQQSVRVGYGRKWPASGQSAAAGKDRRTPASQERRRRRSDHHERKSDLYAFNSHYLNKNI